MEKYRFNDSGLIYPMNVEEAKLRETLGRLIKYEWMEKSDEENGKEESENSQVIEEETPKSPMELVIDKWNIAKQNGNKEKAKQRNNLVSFMSWLEIVVIFEEEMTQNTTQHAEELYKIYPEFKRNVDELKKFFNEFVRSNGKKNISRVRMYFWNLFNEFMEELDITPVQSAELTMVYPAFRISSSESSVKYAREYAERRLAELDSKPNYSAKHVQRIRLQIFEALDFLRENFPVPRDN